MAIGFKPFDVGEFRAQLRAMAEPELLWIGKSLRNLCNSRNPNPVFVVQLKEAREEWRRRHPTTPSSSR
jgi:hypothetical protein